LGKNAIVPGTSLSNESLNMDDEIGTIAPGMQEDLIAVEGDPLKGITALHRVAFVMKGGEIFKGLLPQRCPNRRAASTETDQIFA
jgi:imidazolonepropionase-like amidohydrolase